MKQCRSIHRCAAAVLLGTGSLIAHASPSTTQYEVSVGQSGVAEVTLCLQQNARQIGFAVDTPASRRIVANVRRVSGAALKDEASRWIADDWHSGECLSYTADIDELSRVHSDAGSRYADATSTDPSFWLIRPLAPDRAGPEIVVQLRDGVSISAPWRKIAQAPDATRFHIPPTPSTWSASVVLGQMIERRVDVAGGSLWVSDVGAAATDAEMEKLARWIRAAARSVANVSGGMPVPEARILIFHIGDSDIASRFAAWLYPAAVHGGESARGGGNSIEFEVDASKSDAEFAQDWTAFHELSHLMHPYLGDRGNWLSEGLATYYQTVTRARAGVLSPEEAWRRLGSGFAEVSDAGDGKSLEEVAASMEKTGRFLYVYRSGAFFWLTVDVDLRRASGGRVTLDSAMKAFRGCCLPSYREWQPQEFIARLDRLLGVQTFSKRFMQFKQMKRFPDWQSLYRQLGIRIDSEKASTTVTTRDAGIREAIMGRPSDS